MVKGHSEHPQSGAAQKQALRDLHTNVDLLKSQMRRLQICTDVHSNMLGHLTGTTLKEFVALEPTERELNRLWKVISVLCVTQAMTMIVAIFLFL